MTNRDPSRTTIRTAAALHQGATPAQLRGQQWVHVGHGLVRPAGVDDGPVWTRVSAAVGLLTPGSVLGGWAALWVQGNTWFDGRVGERLLPALVHGGRGARIRPRSGIRVFRGSMDPDEVLDIGGYDVATLARSAFDEMRLARGVRGATVVADMAVSTTAGTPRTTLAAIENVLARHRKVPGVAKIPEALALASTRSASPLETHTRLVAVLDAGLRRVLVNAPIFDPFGNLLGIADLLEPEVGLVIESDGAEHREAALHADDNRREEKFERAGLVVSRVSALDHADRWGINARLRAAQRDARRSTRREWTLTQPPWWSLWPPARRWL